VSRLDFRIVGDGLDRLERNLDANTFFAGMVSEADRLGQRLASRVVKTGLTGGNWQDRPRKVPLARRSGDLARSVVGGADRGTTGLPEIRVGVFQGPSLRYAGILERGGVIKPKTAKALAIPMDRARTATGVARYESPKDYPRPLTFIRFKGKGRRIIGALYETEELAKTRAVGLRGLQAVYLLATSVRIPAFRWLSGPVRENLPFVAQGLAESSGRLLSR
jgi:hypothetical protein